MKKRLRDIADFRVGYQFRGKVRPDPAGTVRVVQIKDVDSDLHIRASALTSVNVERPEPYLIKEGDVLFLNRGHRLYAVIVPDLEPNIIATGYFFILRPHPRLMLPEFLAWSLNQPDFQESLRPYHRGSHIPMISRIDLELLRLQVPPLEVQRQILALNYLLGQERRLSEELQEKRNRLVQAVSRKMMQDSARALSRQEGRL